MNSAAVSKRKYRGFAIGVALVALVVLSLFLLCSCTEREETAASTAIEGVTVDDVTAPYDGKPHMLTVKNILIDDEIAFSTDGTTWTQSFSRSEIGEYHVFVRIRRSGCDDLILRASLTITANILDGVTASDVTVVCDGNPHGIEIRGIRDGDVITYSSDGENFSLTPIAFSDVGRYTVYYRVERGAAYFADSRTVTVLPNILGEYINTESNEIVRITPETVFDVDGTGVFDGKPFAVTDGILIYDGKEYIPLGANDVIYNVTVCGDRVTVIGGASIVVSITFDADGATVEVSGRSITVDNVNYCEPISGVELVRDYATSDVRFETSLTEITITLSDRPGLELSAVGSYLIYDGAEHSVVPELDAGDTALLNVDGVFLPSVASESEVGRYTFTYVVLREGYLPCFVECELVIYPAFDGIYVTESDIISVNGALACVDGKTVDILCDAGGVSIGGKSVAVTDGGILFGGIAYANGDGNYAVVSAGAFRRVVEIEDSLFVHLGENTIALYGELVEGKNGVSLEDSVPIAVFDIGFTATSVTSNGEELVCSDGVYTVGSADIDLRIVWIEAT